jgi:hypothetical protein
MYRDSESTTDATYCDHIDIQATLDAVAATCVPALAHDCAAFLVRGGHRVPTVAASGEEWSCR